MSDPQQPQQPAWQPTQHSQDATPPPPFGYQYPPGYPAPEPPKKRSWFRRHKIMTGLLALVTFGAVVGALGGGGDDAPAAADDVPADTAPAAPEEQATDAADDAQEPATEADAAQVEPAVVEEDEESEEGDAEEAAPAAEESGLPGIGDEARDGDLTFVVTEVETGQESIGDGLTREEAQGQFVVAHISITNHGDRAATFMDMNQALIDDQGREHSTSSATLWLDEGLTIEEVNPGITVEGVLAFDIPTDSTGVELQLHDSPFSGGVSVGLE